MFGICLCPGHSSSLPKMLYQNWISHGLGGWHMFPLQVFTDDTADTDVLQCEQAWIDRFQCMAPNGFTTTSAHKDTAFRHTRQPMPLSVSRVVGSRNVRRRVVTCYKAWMQDRLADTTYIDFFAGDKHKTLVRMSSFLRIGVDSTGQSVIDDRGKWVCPISFVSTLKRYVDYVLSTRYGNKAPGTRAERTICVLEYSSSVYDSINFGAVWRDPDIVAKLPQALRDYFQKNGWPIMGYQ
jgi:hypothetical protein